MAKRGRQGEGGGRPKLPHTMKRVTITLPPDQLEQLKQAIPPGTTFSEWARQVLVREADTMKTETIKSEIIQPVQTDIAITKDENFAGGWIYALEIDGVEIDRYKTQEAAQTRWDAEIEKMKDSGSAY